MPCEYSWVSGLGKRSGQKELQFGFFGELTESCLYMGLLKSVRWRPLTLVLRGVNGYVWMLCYEDVEGVVDVLREVMGLWCQEGRRPEGAAICVFRGFGGKLSLRGAFERGEMAIR